MVETLIKSLNSLQIKELKEFGSKINDLGFNFAVCNLDAQVVLLSQGTAFTSCEASIANNCTRTLKQNSHQEGNCPVISVDEQFLGITLKSTEHIFAVAVIDLGENTADIDRLEHSLQNSKTIRVKE